MKLCYLGHSCFIILILHISFKILTQALFCLSHFLTEPREEAVVWVQDGDLTPWDPCLLNQSKVCHFSYCPDSYPTVSSNNRSWRAKPLCVICPLQQDVTWHNPWKCSLTFQTCPEITVILQQVLQSVWWKLQNTYWEILLLVQNWCIFISGSSLLTKAFFVIDILNHISPLQQLYFSITFNYVRCSMRLKLTSIYLMHYCHFEGQMFLHPMLQQAQLLSIALQRRGSNERYRLRVTHRLDLYSTPPRAQMLPLNYCSLSPFCSNTSTVHWFYGSTWDCYCNILEYLSGFL